MLEADAPARLAAAAPRVLGLDIGGANIKAATASGHSLCVPFSMWLHPEQLAQRLIWLADQLPACDAWAVTMTGEMADVFLDRATGVSALVDQSMQAAGRVGIQEVAFYSVEGRFLSAAQAVAAADSIASANWHALAGWIASWSDAPSLLIDIGGTTTDIIPLDPGRIATASRTDFDRLAAGELVYVGGSRTPVCSLVQSLPFQGRPIAVMREVFATTDDCALVLGLAEEDPEDRATSDGGPRSVAAAINRLARMIGLDPRRVDQDAARTLAQAVVTAAAAAIAQGVARQGSRYAGRWILSGHTADYFLPSLLADRAAPAIVRLADRIGLELSRVAPAFACARLLQERLEAAVERGS